MTDENPPDDQGNGAAEDAASPVAEGRYLSSREISNDEALERLLKHFKGKLKREA